MYRKEKEPKKARGEKSRRNKKTQEEKICGCGLRKNTARKLQNGMNGLQSARAIKLEINLCEAQVNWLTRVGNAKEAKISVGRDSVATQNGCVVYQYLRGVPRAT
jgi:hypothetical protein